MSTALPATSLPPARPVADPSEVLGLWSELARRSGNVFATPEWLLTWWEHLGRGELSLWRLGDAALLPLHLEDGRLRFLGHGLGDVLGPVCAPGDRQAAARGLRVLLDGPRIPWRSFEGADLPDDLPWPELLGAEIVRRKAMPAVRLPAGSWEDFLAGCSRNFRHQVRKRERRLERAGRLRYRVTQTRAELDRDLDAFLALHRARWAPAAGDFAGREAFASALMGVLLERGWLRLRFLELDGRPLAALYNLRFGESESSYQAGRDPAAERYVVGFVLHARALREAVEDGLVEYRLLRGDEAYKWRFANRDDSVVSVRRER
jgi:CelD/BcsL family acetyltransferase involved in cellulose biosynthesis